LINFAAKPDNSQVDLSWETATESNNSYFTIQRSKDGVTFNNLTQVPTEAPNGTSSTPLYYKAYDPSPYQGTSYYRLQQTNLDGTSQYSSIVSVNFDKKSTISVFPNPSAGTVYVNGLDNYSGSVNFSWYDLSGRLVLQQAATVSGGIARLSTNLSNGVYALKFQGADGSPLAVTVIILK
jgi:hypothetical protein